jgi:pimeloyl-ACP methyl ester carboxylesterase/DNA-binding winged helix-turn-helix (wHTH) protein
MAGTYTFGPYRLDAADARLWHGRDAVSLTPKAFAVFEFLVRHAGRLVTKQELLDAVWPDVHVGDAALKVCVREIRRALDDDPRSPRYIETAHRRGYRFIAKTAHPAAPVAAGVGAGMLVTPIGPSMAPPPTHYARSGDVNIAYQVVGDGPIDLVFLMGWVSHLDYFWAEPSFARFLMRLASFSRLILLDKRGTGLSDRVSDPPTLEQRMDDVRAVLDAVGSTQAALFGVSEGGPLCCLYAATYPEKTRALVMFGTYARRIWEPDYPWAPTVEQRERFLDEIREHWGEPVGLVERAPTMANDPAFRSWWATYLRMGASPGAAVALTRLNAEVDVRQVLPTIRVPTLVLHRRHDRCLKIEEGRYVAAQIPGARFVELEGVDHLPFVGEQESILSEIEQFVTGSRSLLEYRSVLATVLAGLIDVPMPAQPVSLDGTGNRFLEHVRREIAWFRGGPLVSEGRNFVAAFDGPARAIRCARALVTAAPRFGLSLRAGLHTGECEAFDTRLSGPAVERAELVAQRAAAGDVLVSRTVPNLVAGSGFQFEDKGRRMHDHAQVFAV